MLPILPFGFESARSASCAVDMPSGELHLSRKHAAFQPSSSSAFRNDYSVTKSRNGGSGSGILKKSACRAGPPLSTFYSKQVSNLSKAVKNLIEARVPAITECAGFIWADDLNPRPGIIDPLKVIFIFNEVSCNFSRNWAV